MVKICPSFCYVKWPYIHASWRNSHCECLLRATHCREWQAAINYPPDRLIQEVLTLCGQVYSVVTEEPSHAFLKREPSCVLILQVFSGPLFFLSFFFFFFRFVTIGSDASIQNVCNCVVICWASIEIKRLCPVLKKDSFCLMPVHTCVIECTWNVVYICRWRASFSREAVWPSGKALGW